MTVLINTTSGNLVAPPLTFTAGVPITRCATCGSIGKMVPTLIGGKWDGLCVNCANCAGCRQGLTFQTREYTLCTTCSSNVEERSERALLHLQQMLGELV